MEDLNGFCDLNLPYTESDTTLEERCKRAFELGYQTVAVNVSVQQEQLQISSKPSKNKKPKLDEDVDTPEIKDFPSAPKLCQATQKLGKILKRLTIKVNDNNFLPFFNNSKTIKEYDLLSICPTSGDAMRNLLKSGFRADIIAFDPDNPKDIRWSRKLYMECISKHLYFELCYSPMIRDSTLRRRIISRGHNFHTFGKSRNIIISSGAENCLELRKPYDVANLGFLLGLNEHQGKLGVAKHAQEVISSAQGRKLGPYRAIIEESQPKNQEKSSN